MTHLSPLGYVLGLQGAALLRAMREGTADREFVEARIAEIRALLDEPMLRSGGVDAVAGAISSAEVYRDWAPTYDQPNTMIELEQPVVRRILDGLPVGVALDAACGTGRHGAYLTELGHRIIGVDESPEMLAVARERLPEAELHQAHLARLPLPDDAVDTIVCGLALAYLPDLGVVLAEFARVLRPGGHLVVSDAHQLLSYLRPTLPREPGPDGRPSILVEYHRPLSAYLAAALPLGFQVRGCAELVRPMTLGEAPHELPSHMSWDLQHWCPEASLAAISGVPSVVVWHFQLDATLG
ncbi:class I SAM-dependent methyltransferase [Catellatospora tritici]|uniref:class I SAM-dependent methyltransferase n=1 Tax=Catellatospora tritici TaxID=2851566 RepID=UPI001C2DDFD1|nr:class I SAM-dependent methyltransferase [Catellatospora tritici]MBV1855575.1 class I SAM-dependent methyltransferase [Catellatospora tritici]